MSDSYHNHRSMDEETLSLPPRDEKKPSPSKAATKTMSHALRSVFPVFFKNAKIVPGPGAKPAEIREYLVRLLVKKRELPEDDAERVVASWQVGSGLELRQYGAVMYLELFGREHGWILYREVKMSVRKERQLILRYPLHTVTIGSIALAATTISLLATLDMGESITIILVCVAFLTLISSFVCLVLQCFGTSAAKMIERELKAATKLETRSISW